MGQIVLSPEVELIWNFRTEIISCFYIVALKKNVLLRVKTKDAKLRLLFPHISDSVFCDYLTGISTAFPFSLFQVLWGFF